MTVNVNRTSFKPVTTSFLSTPPAATVSPKDDPCAGAKADRSRTGNLVESLKSEIARLMRDIKNLSNGAHLNMLAGVRAGLLGDKRAELARAQSDLLRAKGNFREAQARAQECERSRVPQVAKDPVNSPVESPAWNKLNLNQEANSGTPWYEHDSYKPGRAQAARKLEGTAWRIAIPLAPAGAVAGMALVPETAAIAVGGKVVSYGGKLLNYIRAAAPQSIPSFAQWALTGVR